MWLRSWLPGYWLFFTQAEPWGGGVMVEESVSAAYGRGHDAGAIDQRLKGVEEHLARNNGSIADQVAEQKVTNEKLAGLTAAVDHLAAEVKARFAQTEAVHAEGQRQRVVRERSWSLYAKLAIAAGVLILAAVLILVLVQ